MKLGFEKRILVGITGYREKDWKDKLEEIEKFKIKEAALFLEMFKKNQREKIYKALKKSGIKRIPLVHIRHDMDKNELDFLFNNFKTRYFTIHEDGFKHLSRWKGYFKNLFLEMNTDNKVSKIVDVKKIGGFCVDFSHFKCAEEEMIKEFEYVFSKKNMKRYFKCNHLNGYDFKKNTDKHTVESLKDFDYLKSLPEFLFGKAIALETFNSIKEQLKFKKYLIKLFRK